MKKSKNYVFNIWIKLHKHWGFSSLYDIHKQIKSSLFKGEIDLYRRLVESSSYYHANGVKLSLLSFTPSGIFSEAKKRSVESLIEYTGLMVLDIDKLETKDKVIEIFNKVIQMEYTTLAFVSPSGYGIKIIVITNNQNSKQHTFFYKNLVKYYEDTLEVKLDDSTCDVSRLCFFSYDPNAYYNETARVFEFENINNEQIMIETNKKDTHFELCMKEMFDFTNNKQAFEIGNRNNFVYLFLKNSYTHGLEKDEVELYCIENFVEDGFAEKEIKNSVNSVYNKNNPDEFGKWRKRLENKITTEKTPKQTLRANKTNESISIKDFYYTKIMESVPTDLLECANNLKTVEEKDAFLIGRLTGFEDTIKSIILQKNVLN